nr:abortive infection family protein [Solimonas terrae]
MKRSQIRAIEEAMGYPRGYGYVLDFSDRTLEEFFDEEFGVEIFASENKINGGSKRNCLTTFLVQADSHLALRVLRALWDRREGLLESAPSSEEAAAARTKSPAFQDVISSLQGDPAPLTTAGVEAFAKDRTLEELVADIERTLAANKPEVAIDHLHTYCMKKFAHLLEVRGETCEKDEPLHSRFGRYRKCLEAEQDLHEFTTRALKTFISLLDSFNDLRNNHSLAHDNQLLAPMEARFIFSSISSILVLLRALEAGRYGE